MKIKIILGLVTALLVGVLISSDKSPVPILSGIAQGSAYEYSTSTGPGAFAAEASLKGGAGEIGGVLITGAGAGTMTLYNATTSNALLRAASQSTSSILITSFPNSTAAGYYPVEIPFNRGLYIVISGAIPTSTITWR